MAKACLRQIQRFRQHEALVCAMSGSAHFFGFAVDAELGDELADEDLAFCGSASRSTRAGEPVGEGGGGAARGVERPPKLPQRRWRQAVKAGSRSRGCFCASGGRGWRRGAASSHGCRQVRADLQSDTAENQQSSAVLDARSSIRATTSMIADCMTAWSIS